MASENPSAISSIADIARITDKVIGKGSFGKVYLAQDVESHEWLAVKAIDKRKLSPRLLQSIWNEIQMMKKISHPNIMALRQVHDSPDYMHLYLEYCNLGDLSHFILAHKGQNSLGGIPVSFIHSFLYQIADALSALRQLNLVHRDLKPQNILLSCHVAPSYGTPLAMSSSTSISKTPAPSDVVLKLGDFGFARILHGQDMAETLCGSPLYMAPEILRYEKYDAKADLWSLGVILYELIAGRTPFRARNHVALLKKIMMTKNVLFPDEALERRISALSSLSNQQPQQSNPISIPRSSQAPIDIPHGATFAGYGAMHNQSPETRNTLSKGSEEIPSDLRELTRMLLKKDPVERISFEEFFLQECVRQSRSIPTPVAASLPISRTSLPSPSDFKLSTQQPRSRLNSANMPTPHHQYSPGNSSPVSHLSMSLPAEEFAVIKRTMSNLSISSSKSHLAGPFQMDDIEGPPSIAAALPSSTSKPRSRRPSTTVGTKVISWSPNFQGLALPFADPSILSQHMSPSSLPTPPSSLPAEQAGVMGYVTSSFGAVARAVQGRHSKSLQDPATASAPLPIAGPNSRAEAADMREEWEELDVGEYIIVNRRRYYYK